LVITGNDGHYYDTLQGKIDIQLDGFIHVPGNWTNSSNSGVFTTNVGRVTLNGNRQRIQGTSTTLFPDLFLAGNGDKTLYINTLVGGGYNNNGIGILQCNDQYLSLNSHVLIVNNQDGRAIAESGGGIVSENDESQGYGVVQWNIRDNTGTFTVPFVSQLKQPVPYTFDIRSPGNSILDSGFVSIATHPTDPSLIPNNRMLPSPVLHTQNEFGRENSDNLLDRYWVLSSEQYNTKPLAISSFGYLDAEWDASGGSTNTITESNLRPVVYNTGTNSWDYPGAGATDVNTNSSTGTSGQLDGIWVLSDTTVCPSALFSWDGNCALNPISFTDETIISEGSIETWQWGFGDGSSATETNPIHVFNVPGNHPTQLIVVGSSGCPDTLIQSVSIDPKATADFMFDDDPLVGIPVTFTENTQNSNSWDWDFGDGVFDVGASVRHTYETEGNYIVELVANNSANCPDTTTQLLEVNLPSLFLVPTAFSPGEQDELNKDFGLTTLQRVSEYKLQIYNRWGEKIFESNDIQQRWDGSYMNKPVMNGSYFYIITFRDRIHRWHSMNGEVTVLR
jgi:gliding motility-associated-like protein